MLSIVVPVTFAAVGIAMLLNIFRLIRGPDLEDRILALDTLTINTIALVMLAGIILATRAYFEAALILAMMGFVGTVALGKYLIGGDIIE
ncbi:MAG: K+/H+ antiporter subunit F [Sphingomonadaceae bacterium]